MQLNLGSTRRCKCVLHATIGASVAVIYRNTLSSKIRERLYLWTRQNKGNQI
jgi:hypothetical protein